MSRIMVTTLADDEKQYVLVAPANAPLMPQDVLTDANMPIDDVSGLAVAAAEAMLKMTACAATDCEQN
jgi:hypothetical protein